MFHSLLHIRLLNPSDIDTIKNLCIEWFPIKYPDTWYREITSNNHRFYSVVAVVNDQIVGLLVAEIKPYLNCDFEDYGFLSKFDEKNSKVAYILTLGVIHTMRRNGIATLLIKHLVDNLENNPLNKNCKAIYLHVLTTNNCAIGFYEKLNFNRYKLLPLYYSINDHAYDGYSYVFYVNGGRPSFWWLPMLDPKIYLLIARNKLKHFYHYTVRNIFKCDQIKCFALILNNLTPYRYLRNFFNKIMFPFGTKGPKPKSYLYVC